MRVHNAPSINRRYWVAITAASVFGANLGDLCSHNLGLGHVRGLPFLAMIFAAITLAERRSRIRTEAFYWAAIITLRTAATNLADFATHDLKLSYVGFILLLVLALGGLVSRMSRRNGQAAIERLQETGASYWMTMLLAGILGTALGDYCADELGLGTSACVWIVIWAAAIAVASNRPRLGPAFYWFTIVVVRTVGTNLGDYLAGRHGFSLGLPMSTSFSAVIFVALLVAWPRRDSVAP